MRRLGIAIVLVALAAAPAAADDPPPQRTPHPTANSGSDLSIVTVRRGALSRSRIEHDQLVARNAAGEVIASQPLTPATRAHLLAASRLAAEDPDTQDACAEDETFVSVTVDARTTSSAVCPKHNAWFSHSRRWSDLVALLRTMLEGRR